MHITLQTERLLLRPLTTDDLHTAHAYAGNPENTKYMIFLPNNSLAETERFLKEVNLEWQQENPEFYEFAVILNGKHIGAVGVYLNGDRSSGELGWILHMDVWGKGYATEAALAVKDFALSKLRINKLVAHCDARNSASARVMQKLGMMLERDDEIRTNRNASEPSQELMYSLTAE